ncbi:MAG: TIGR03620 family F420-dependent LLM class oxidoreductase [Candidatus Binatia bacterium]
MEIGKLGIWCSFEAMTSSDAAAAAARVESLGYGTLWFPEALGREAFASASFLLASTSKIVVATGIANIWARDAMTMACGSRTLAEQSAGRFLLGIGVSHRPIVTGLRGHRFEKPLSTMRSYLDAMQNAPYAAVAPAEEAPCVIGALHPKMLALSAARTRGSHTYLVPPEHTAFARETMGAGSWICVEQKVLLESDPAKARSLARNVIAMYLALPNYRTNLERFGYADNDFAAGGSDRLVDALVAWGNENAIAARIQAHRDAGADHVCIQALHPDGLPLPDWNVLEGLAPQRNP